MSIMQLIQNTHQSEKSLSQSITQMQFQEHTLLKIDHPMGKAAISLQGAHLLYWQPTNEKIPVIWLSEKALFKKGTPIRGGIPICWPWFSNASTPMHGFARIVDWQLQSYQETNEAIDIILLLKDTAQTKQYWPHNFELEAKIHLGKTCGIELSCQGDFEATTALHTYFGISDISTITLTGLGEAYHDKLSTINKSQIIGQMTFNQEVDRVYTHPESITYLKDSTRTIKITHINHSDVVTWNPWIEKTKATNDLADQSYHNFVCVETCRINKPIKSTTTQKTTYGVTIEVVKG